MTKFKLTKRVTTKKNEQGLALRVKPFFCVMLLCSFLWFSSVTVSASDRISRSYFATQSLPVGTLVSYQKLNPDTIEPASLANDNYLIGPVVSEGDSLVEVKSEAHNVSVVSSGTAAVLVSDINGYIKKGDLIALSQVKGVAGLYTKYGDVGRIVGVAAQDFDANNSSNKSYDLPDLNNRNIRVGLIWVNLNIRDSGQLRGLGSGGGALVGLGEKLVGRSVTLAQAITGTTIFLATVLISTITLYGSVRGGFTSIGRNPFAGALIYTGLTRVLVLVTLMLAIGSVVSYLVLLL